MSRFTNATGGGFKRNRIYGSIFIAGICAAVSVVADEPAASPSQPISNVATAAPPPGSAEERWSRVNELRRENKVPTSGKIPKAAVADAESVQSLADKWGIQISGMFLSSGGNMIDFRYKVLDPVKAAILTQAETKPELINQSSGSKLIVPSTPKAGQLRQITKQPVVGKTYFILFANSQHLVKSGDKVTISAGDFKVENLIVE